MGKKTCVVWWVVIALLAFILVRANLPLYRSQLWYMYSLPKLVVQPNTGFNFTYIYAAIVFVGLRLWEWWRHSSAWTYHITVGWKVTLLEMFKITLVMFEHLSKKTFRLLCIFYYFLVIFYLSIIYYMTFV